MTQQEPRVLVVSPQTPWPAESGFRAKLAGFLNALPVPWDLIAGSDGSNGPVRENVHLLPIPTSRYRTVRALSRGVLPASLSLPLEPVSRIVTQLLRMGRHYQIIHLDTLGGAHLAAPLTRLAAQFGQHPRVISSINDSYSLLLRSYPGMRVRAHARLAQLFERRYLPQSHIVDVVTERDASWLTSTAPNVNVRVVPLGIGVSDFAGDPLPTQWDMVYVGAGGLGPGPWVRDMLDHVLPQVFAVAPTSRFAVAGPDIPDRLRTRVERLGGVCLGFVPDLSRLYRSARMVLVPSAQESGTPTKALQAMASGVPVVGRDQLDGIPNSRDGISLLRAGDNDGFVARILAILADPDYGREIGRRGRELVTAQHDWSAVLNRYLAL